MHNKQVVIFWNKGSILHAIICIYILYEFCIQIVYIIFTMYTFCRSELMSLCIQNLYKMYPTFWQTFVYKMYTKCIQTVYLQNVSHISTNFCTQNVYKMYTKCLFTKCIPHFDKLLYTKCIQNVYKMFIYKMYPTFRQTFVYKMCTKFLRSMGVICYERWVLSKGHKNYFRDWCLINSQTTFLFLTFLHLMNYGDIIKSM